MRKVLILFLLLLGTTILWAESDLGRLVPLGFSVPEHRFTAPELEAWLDGEKLTLVSGRTPVLLYFWGSHIPGSMADLGSLDELYNKLSSLSESGRLSIAAVNLNDEAALVNDYADNAQLSLPLYLFPETLPAPYIMKSVPSLWLIDSRGRAAAACEGNVPWNHPDLLRSLQEFACE